jgi:tetratricopeptide (TPR) repeat protein
MLAEIAVEAGDYAAAQRELERTLDLTRALGYRFGEGSALSQLSEVACIRGDYTRAYSLAVRALAVLRELGGATEEAIALAGLGYLCTLLGDYAGARDWFAQFRRVVQAPGAPASERLNGLLPLALLAHRTGDDRQALVVAEESWEIAQRLDDPLRQAWALLLIGHAQAALGRPVEATAAYQGALQRYRALGRAALAAEPRAGLARLALARGDLAAAQEQVEAMLPVLAEGPPLGLLEPFDDYLTAYRILAATGDPRASGVLRAGRRLLQAYAERIEDDAIRRSFLEDVATHRELLRDAPSIGADEHSFGSERQLSASELGG